MIEKREKEWQELERKALQMLENPRLLPEDLQVNHFISTLHLWTAPSFTPHKHWVFYNPRPQLNPFPKPRVSQIVWESEFDFKRLNDPLIGVKKGFHTDPTFKVKTIEIEREIFKKLHDELAEIRISAFIQDYSVGGLDGEHFGVETLGFYHNAKVMWWSEYSEDWKELVDWFEKVRRFLEEKFK